MFHTTRLMQWSTTEPEMYSFVRTWFIFLAQMLQNRYCSVSWRKHEWCSSWLTAFGALKYSDCHMHCIFLYKQRAGILTRWLLFQNDFGSLERIHSNKHWVGNWRVSRHTSYHHSKVIPVVLIALLDDLFLNIGAPSHSFHTSPKLFVFFLS